MGTMVTVDSWVPEIQHNSWVPVGKRPGKIASIAPPSQSTHDPYVHAYKTPCSTPSMVQALSR
jgi:hypothetical protein